MKLFARISTVLSLALVASTASAAVTINGYNFDLGQFSGAAVTYRSGAGSGVAFAGKLWDNQVGVDGYTPGELAMGQSIVDLGDQISLTKRDTPDWFQLTYAGAGLTIDALNHMFVVYEITSNNTALDVEGTSWKVRFNGGPLVTASSATVKQFIDTPSPAENVNLIAFDLLSFGFSPGDMLKSIYFENIDSGVDDSDPDFIFTALATEPAVVPEPASLVVWSLIAISVGGAGWWRRKKRSA